MQDVPLSTRPLDTDRISFEDFRAEVLHDYRIAHESRQTSLLGRREVLTGKAKFGIFGDGKELPQIAMAKVFKPGDFRSGYYRDQTFMMAAGLLTVRQFFAQLYAHPDLEAEPMTGGRQMNGHYATRWIQPNGSWMAQTEHKNSSADISPTAGQMPRLLGLALASKVYRNQSELHHLTAFSHQGNEVAFGSIGDASTSEGLFWETMNAASVMQVPMAISVWDDGYGISVPKEFQTTKGSISKALSGFEKNEDGPGFIIKKARAWNYPELIEAYQTGIAMCRKDHLPVLFHIEECTQPQGHSTSGSHERYKDKKRLQWEEKFDGLRQFAKWIIKNGLADEAELQEIEEAAIQHVKEEKNAAWQAYQAEILTEKAELLELLSQMNAPDERAQEWIQHIQQASSPMRKDLIGPARRLATHLRLQRHGFYSTLQNWLLEQKRRNYDRYNGMLYDESGASPLRVPQVAPIYTEESPVVDGRIVLRDNFDALLTNDPRFIAFGEDVGKIGGVNQTFEGLQEKFGEGRVFDTGIREATIAGQGIGMAMRGLRPYAEIQYLDYLLYCLQILSDDAATVQYRTKGGQKAPVIIGTRGHRLEGIWHSGSPMGAIVHAVRGMHVCVPRNMVQAAGMYNTLFKGEDPAIVVEPLNGYRLKERRPENMGEFTVALGQPEILREGNSISIVTYGSSCRIALEAAELLSGMGVDAEVVDVQTLLPFDLNHKTVESLQKTGRILFLDEDVPGGASAFMMQQVLEEQGGYMYLDVAPATLTAQPHRPAYGTDGDYFSKPGVEDVVEKVLEMMHEVNPNLFPQA